MRIRGYGGTTAWYRHLFMKFLGVILVGLVGLIIAPTASGQTDNRLVELAQADDATCAPRPLPTRNPIPTTPARPVSLVGGVPLDLPDEMLAIGLHAPDSGGLSTAPEIGLYRSGELIGSRERTSSGAFTMAEITEAVDNPNWIEEVQPGVYQMRAALVQNPGTSLDLSAPHVNELRLVADPGVMMYGLDAGLNIDGVRITSWNLETEQFDEIPDDGRPFITYGWGSQITVDDAEFIGLGSDRLQAYGFTIRDYATEAEVTDSYFAYNYFGYYTWQAEGLVLDNNLFELNDVYGIDPHDRSRDLTIINNTSRCNGRHGLIVSADVTGSLIRGNVSYMNRLNGIVVDKRSHHSQVFENVAWGNLGDGIVVTDSRDIEIENNSTFDNRIGIRIAGSESTDVDIFENQIQSNFVGLEVQSDVGDVHLRDNVWTDNSDTGLVLASSSVDANNEVVSGSARAVDVRGPAVFDGITIDRADAGIIVRDGLAVFDNVSIDADERGVFVEDGAVADVSNATIDADRALVGSVVRANTETSDDLYASRVLFRLAIILPPVILAAIIFAGVHKFAMRNRQERFDFV